MRALIQRVTSASVSTEGEEPRSIGAGYAILLGVGPDDTERIAEALWDKIAKMRIFEDDNGKTNLSLADVGGSVLIVSQFTLYADCRKGNRPSFTRGAAPDRANELYEHFAACAHVRHRRADRVVRCAHERRHRQRRSLHHLARQRRSGKSLGS